MRFLDTSRIRVQLDRHITAGDGTRLSIDLYLPPRAGRYPVLLYRTATDNNRSPLALAARQLQPGGADRWKGYAAQGFIVATADVRGRGDSAGTFVPFVHEGDDGVATVDWLRNLPECDGRVGAFGTGYAAFCAWAAIAAGASIDAVVSISPFGAVGDGFLHRGGAVRLDWLFWMHLTGGRTLQSPALPPWPDVYRHLPLSSMDTVLGRSDIPWKTWLAHLNPGDPFWAPLRIRERLEKRPVPGLHISGMWDGQLGGARYYYQAAQRSGAPQSFIIGPWNSAAIRYPSAVVGGFGFGLSSMVEIDDIIVQFFAAQLRGETNQWAKSRSRCFITGRNEWVDGMNWPAAAGDIHELHLVSAGCANTRRGDGALIEKTSSSECFDEVIHNPEIPVDFQPNFRSFAAAEWSLSLDQGHVTARDEALVYTSAPLSKSLTAWGRPAVTLVVRCATPDADFYVLLSDVFPSGNRDLHLSHAAIRLAAAREATSREATVLTLQLDEVAHEFLPGHSVRLTIVSSLFPAYARNPHRSDYLDAAESVVSAISVHHGGANTSSLRLPTIEHITER